MNRVFIIYAVFLIFSHINAVAQEEPEMVTDRPDQTESANIVSPGYLQIETGFVFTSATYKMGTVDAESTALNIATTLVRIGITNFAELRIGSAYSIYHCEFGPHSSESDGFEPVVIGMKAKISGSGSFIESAVLLNLRTPMGNEDYSPEYLQPEIIFTFAKDITDNISIGWNAGAAWNNYFSPEIPEYIYSIALGIGITEQLGGFLEWYARAPEEFNAQHLIDAGFTYSILPNLQLDASGGAAITEDSPDWFVNAGLSWMFPIK